MTRTWKRNASLAVALVFVAGTAFAQDTQSDPMRGQRSSINASAGQGDQKDFVKKMMQANMAEIQLGQLAADHAQSNDVKQYAQMIVDDHTKSSQQLQPLAQQLGVTAPTDLDGKHKALASRLSKLQGAEFDREFMKAMIADHKDVISKTQKIAGSSGSASGQGSSGTAATTGTAGATGTSGSTADSAASFASMTLPILQKHLQDAQQIQQRLK